MFLTFLTHPVTTFCAGVIIALGAVVYLLNANMLPNRTAEDVASYRESMEKVSPSGLPVDGPGEKAALERFTSFLKGIGDPNFVRAKTLQTYSSDAYLDDTLVIHHGAAEIEAYFVKTSETMTSYHLAIDDIARSGDDFYIRWTMQFAAPLLSEGKPIHSVGVSQVRFNRDGKVAFHQDFWDSGKNFYSRLPIVGGAVGYVSKRLQSN